MKMNPVNLDMILNNYEKHDPAVTPTSVSSSGASNAAHVIATELTNKPLPIGPNLAALNILNWGSDMVMEFKENIDCDKLNFIVQNKDIFEPLLRPDKRFENLNNSNYKPFTMSLNYRDRARGGVVPVTYIQKQGVGRFFAVQGLSLQSITRQIRQTIARDTYIDIDMVNCHPNILKFICQQLDIEHPILSKYCDNRDQFFKDNNVTKAVGKVAMLSIMNGGCKAFLEIKNPGSDMKYFFKYEIKDIQNSIVRAFPVRFKKHLARRIAEGETWNHESSFMNIILCDIENKILQVMLDFFERPEGAVMCFDGVMLPIGPKYDTAGCEKMIYEKLKIPMKIAIKPFEEFFDMEPYDIQPYEEFPLNTFSDFRNMVDKKILVDCAKEWVDNSLALIFGAGSSFYVTKERVTDTSTGEITSVYTPVKKEHLLDTLDVEVKMRNPTYNSQLKKKIEAMSIRKAAEFKRSLSSEEKESLNKYCYTQLNDLVKDMAKSLKIPNYNKLEFIPHLKDNPPAGLKNVFNMFPGFPLEDVVQRQYGNFEDSLVYKHIMEVICNGDPGEGKHFLDCIADMLQDPASVKCSAHVFYSEPGTGKTMLGEFMSMLLGSKSVQSYTNTEAYFSKFNANRTYKILKIFEEVEARGSAYANHNRLKGEITNKKERIEPKGREAYEVDHFARFWFFSNPNGGDPLKIDAGDRRFTVHRVSHKYINDKEYFNNLHNEITDMQACKIAFKYFSERKYDEGDVTHCYETAFKTEQKISCLGLGTRFLKETIEERFNGMHLFKDRVPVKSLQAAFKRWCEENGSPSKFNSKVLQSQIREVLGDSKQPSTQRYVDSSGNKSSPKCWTFEMDHVLKCFRRYLKDPSFEFDLVELNTEDNQAGPKIERILESISF
jgi:hypothetical protein